MTRFALVTAAMAAFMSLAPAIPSAHAETTQCTEITALPITITVQGIYCLKQNLNVNIAGIGNAITINAGNVTIDFNGFRINNQAPLSNNHAVGVFAQGRNHVTLKNGFIRGFFSGIRLTQSVIGTSANHLVEDMKIADSGLTGMRVDGNKSVVRNNRVLATGGGPSAGNVIGIDFQYADDGQADGNIITGVSSPSVNQGIFVSQSKRVLVAGNVLTGINGGCCGDHGIVLQNVDQAIVAGNRLLNVPLAGSVGISDSTNNSNNIACIDNIIGGFGATPFSGCNSIIDNHDLFD